MNPILNPYTPGAGTQPSELVGRDELREDARVALARITLGRPSKSLVMVGLRGVGKTVLLDRIREDAEAQGIHTLQIEAPENLSLPSILAPQLRSVLIRLSHKSRAQKFAQRALRGLAGFATALKVKYQDIEVGLDFDPEPGLADNGNLGIDLQDLFEVVGNVAKADETCIALFIDELQYVKEDELAALITALHRTAQRRLPLTMFGAGLPQVRAQLGEARSYAERLFDFPEVGPLSPEDAGLAIMKPAQNEDVQIESEVRDAIVDRTEGYPYFLQVWGKHLWDVAESSPITIDNFAPASDRAIADLDRSFFLVRFDRLAPSEKKYLRAMAELGAGPHRSGDIAQTLRRKVSSLAPTRAQLIRKGMIWSPRHGYTAFTVPMFNEFMLRIIPNPDY